MSLKKHVQLMASYNQWMNEKLYLAASQLDEVALHLNRGAFFGSIYLTLNHIAVADTIWLKRLSANFLPDSGLPDSRQFRDIHRLDAPLFDNFQDLYDYRIEIDRILISIGDLVDEAMLLDSVHYHDLKGHPFSKNLFSLLMHLFNHQTHHRGQITTMLNQIQVDIGVTDLNALIPSN
ncbi:DinB family protein [Undibacterium fentianense]|uniref:DinB family protein n=1 Tax=Undibacterium fentianense TaxID=2828728 RepID=A0A941IGD4_9BURK|nr:DinB family protein [Undibacterium fentianense]MBR7801257.1 DinB family protein [Undibacterium fentianense]